MYKLIFLLHLAASLQALPLEDTEPLTTVIPQVTDQLLQTTKDSNISMYLQNFTDVMASYVYRQNYNLTDEARIEIKHILEGFLIQFAEDMKDAVENADKIDQNLKMSDLEDGFDNSVFENIKNNINYEFPGLKENVVNEIVNRLRYNLFVTKQKLYFCINKNSQ